MIQFTICFRSSIEEHRNLQPHPADSCMHKLRMRNNKRPGLNI